MLDFEKNPLLPVVVQDWKSQEILMLAWLDREALDASLQTGLGHYHSRSRGKLWRKGEESGHVQIIKEILVDCDRDSVVFKVEQAGGAACHTGYSSCFYRRLEPQGTLKVIKESKVFDPISVYRKTHD